MVARRRNFWELKLPQRIRSLSSLYDPRTKARLRGPIVGWIRGLGGTFQEDTITYPEAPNSPMQVIFIDCGALCSRLIALELKIGFYTRNSCMIWVSISYRYIYSYILTVLQRFMIWSLGLRVEVVLGFRPP